MPRSSIYVGEIAHQSPIPNASRIGNIIVSGLIRGADPATARLAATLEQQCAFIFLHMRQVVEAGGATVEDIIKVTVWMKELQRKPVDDEWVKVFPDPASRPARQSRTGARGCTRNALQTRSPMNPLTPVTITAVTRLASAVAGGA